MLKSPGDYGKDKFLQGPPTLKIHTQRIGELQKLNHYFCGLENYAFFQKKNGIKVPLRATPGIP
jgi:hypothetical protein